MFKRAHLLALLLILAAPTAFATVHEIQVGNFFFSPLGTTVQPGDTVRWILASGSHTTTSTVDSPKSWDSGNLGSLPGSQFELEFTVGDGPGPFPYVCTFHSGSMKDTIFMDIPVEECCTGTTGNINGDAGDNVTLTDLTVLVNSLFVTFEALDCPAEANTNGDANCNVTLTDLTVLVNSLFVTFDPLADCSSFDESACN